MIKAKTKVLVLAALTAFAFLLPYLRITACEKKYRGYYDRLEYAQYTPNPTQALATLDSIIVPNDCLCSYEVRKVEYQKYVEKAYFFSNVFINRNSPPVLDSTLLYYNRALELVNKIEGKDRYVSVADLYLFKGLVYERSGDCNNALLYADKALVLCKHFEDLLTEENALGIKSRCLKKLGRTGEAISLDQKADSLEKKILKKVSGMSR
jgi:tetratricopeptide (TPR) repeat protein